MPVAIAYQCVLAQPAQLELVLDLLKSACTITSTTASLSLPAHTSTADGTGAVGGIIPIPTQNRLISYGAEGTVAVIDLRRAAVHTKFTEHTSSSSSVRGGSFIYCMALAGQSLLVTGAGSGMLLVHDLQRLKLLYGMSANQLRLAHAEPLQTCAIVISGGKKNCYYSKQ
eukprot:14693-Heterococcus_DN1.PRE.1